jgi:hypothetical protein
MIVDLATGETYGEILYRDAATIVFGTLDPGAVQLRESAIAADALGQVVDVEGIGRGALARYQEVDAPPEAGAAVLFQQRRDALAAYASQNGDQISVHQQRDRPARLPSLARWRRDLFGNP